MGHSSPADLVTSKSQKLHHRKQKNKKRSPAKRASARKMKLLSNPDAQSDYSSDYETLEFQATEQSLEGVLEEGRGGEQDPQMIRKKQRRIEQLKDYTDAALEAAGKLSQRRAHKLKQRAKRKLHGQQGAANDCSSDDDEEEDELEASADGIESPIASSKDSTLKQLLRGGMLKKRQSSFRDQMRSALAAN